MNIATLDGASPASFDWHRSWYPIAVEQDLNPGIPHPVQLLGKHLVIWKSGVDKTWRIFEDRCPHRLAPLSEGRIEPSDGSLYCNYHGWRFSGEGTCLNIPQLAEQQTRTIQAARACATTYPTCVDEGLIWCWPTSGAEAQKEAHSQRANNGGAGITQFTGPDENLVGGWYMRDVPVRWETVRENAFNDPSHDNVLHHGYFIADRNNAQTAYTVEITNLNSLGFTSWWQTADAGAQKIHCRSNFPTAALLSHRNGSSVGYFVPLAPNLTRHFHGMLRKGTPGQRLQTAETPGDPRKKNFLQLAEMWKSHLLFHDILDADIAIQAGVDRNRARRAKAFTPAAADRQPAAFHQWLKRHGGGGVPFEQGPDDANVVSGAQLQRVQLLDRFLTHTVHCNACRQAYAAMQQLQKLACVATGILFFAACAAVAYKGFCLAVLGLGALSGVGLAVASRLQASIQRFVFVDYDEHHISKTL
ncbi:Pheophorbide a oxygenase, chloroplastic [Coccomyxa sp. Obi]|nr:Pheophorbide a oxygenase, chloroplastic [Coccomyxa sp. Obi]